MGDRQLGRHPERFLTPETDRQEAIPTMLKLVKWTLIGALGMAGAGYFVFGDNVVSYVSTMASSVKESVRGEIPIEFELKRAESLIRDIDPQIRQCERDVARAEVRLERLVDDVEGLERAIVRGERKLKSGAEQLAAWDGDVHYRLASGQTISRERVEIDLERTFESFKANQSMMKSKKVLIERETAAVAAARTKLDTVRAEKSRMVDLIGQLKTQQAQVDAMKASSRNFTLDDSALGEAKEVLAEVKERLDVAQKILQNDLFFEGQPHGSHPRRDIAKEIRQHFSAGAEVVEGAPARLTR